MTEVKSRLILLLFLLLTAWNAGAQNDVRNYDLKSDVLYHFETSQATYQGRMVEKDLVGYTIETGTEKLKLPFESISSIKLYRIVLTVIDKTGKHKGFLVGSDPDEVVIETKRAGIQRFQFTEISLIRIQKGSVPGFVGGGMAIGAGFGVGIVLLSGTVGSGFGILPIAGLAIISIPVSLILYSARNSNAPKYTQENLEMFKSSSSSWTELDETHPWQNYWKSTYIGKTGG